MPGPRWQPGMMRAERETARAALVDWLAEHGYDEAHELVKGCTAACAVGSHELCDAEMPGGTGCPCEHHDATADQVAELWGQWETSLA